MLSVSVSLPLPSFRSYRIAFYFYVAVAGGLELRPLGCAGNSTASPLGLTDHSPIWRERRLRNSSMDTNYGNGYGNVKLETTHDADTASPSVPHGFCLHLRFTACLLCRTLQWLCGQTAVSPAIHFVAAQKNMLREFVVFNGASKEREHFFHW